MDATALLQGGTRLSLTLLLGITLVLALPGWKPQKQYEYQIDGRTVAGVVSEQNQNVGIHYRGKLSVQTHSSRILIMKLENVMYWQIHEELPEGWWAESSSSAQENFSELPLTNSAFTVKLRKNGEVEEIQGNPDLPDWEQNLIKGIVSQIQYRNDVGLKRQLNAIHRRESSESSSWDRIMESTAFGRCETLYQVSPVPEVIGTSFPEWFPPKEVCKSKKYFEIFKTTNFSNCETQAETHFGLPETMNCDPTGNHCGGFWNRVSGSRIAGCADRKEFIILQSETNSRALANLDLYNASVASVSSYIAINLTSVNRLEQPLGLPSLRVKINPSGYQYTTYDFTSVNDFFDMKSEEEALLMDAPITTNVTELPKRVYNLTNLDDYFTSDWHLPPFDFEHPPQQPLSAVFLHQKECSEANSLIQKFKELITNVASDFEDAQNIPNTMPMEQLTLAVQLCRTMSLSTLKKAIGKIMDKTIKTNKLLLTERNLYRDVVMMCGTAPSTWIITEWIEQQKITGEEAANIIASLPVHLRDPRPAMVERLYNFSVKLKDRKLKVTAILSLSNFIRIACVNTKARSVRFPKTVLSPACTEKDVEPYLTWFSSQLDADPALKRGYILALGNTGTVYGLETLASVAKNTSYSAYLRVTAVLAMKYQAFLYPRKTSEVLFSLFQDYSQPIAVRLSAVSMLFYSRPQYDVFQRIALSTWYEPSTSVAGFVRSSLESMSKFKDPVYKSMSANARRVVLYSKPISSTLHLSYNWLLTIIFEEPEETWAYQRIFANEIDASSYYFRFTKRISQLTRLPIDADIWLSNKDGFLSMIKEWFYPRGNRSEVRPPIDNLGITTRRVRNMLNIKERTMPDMEGEVHISIDKLTERLFIFDKKTLQDMLNGTEDPTTQIQFQHQNAEYGEFEFSVVTELGFPLSFKLSVPWSIKFAADFNTSQSLPQVEAKLSLMFTSHRIGKLSFYTPWDQRIYSVESHGVNFGHIEELDAKAQLDNRTQKLNFEVQTKIPEKGHLLLQYSTETFTSHRNVADSTPRTLTRTWRPINLKPSLQMSKSFKLGRHFEAHVNYSKQLPSSFPPGQLDILGALFGLPMMWPSFEYKNLQIKILKMPKIQFDIGRGSAKKQNGKVIVSHDSEKSKNETKTLSAIENDLLSQIESVVNNSNSSRKVRTIPSGSARPPATEKPSVTHTPPPPTKSTTLSPAKELLSNVIRQTAHAAVDEVMQLVNANHNTETAPSQHVSEVFDASNINTTKTHRYSTYILRESLNGISNGESKLVYMNITLSDAHESEQNESIYSVYITHAEDYNRTQQNLGIFLKEETQRSKWEIGWTSTLQSPEVSYLKLKDIQQTIFKTVLFSSLQYRIQDTYHNIALEANMQRSNKKMEMLNKQLIQRQCSDIVHPECRTLAYDAMLSDMYNVTLLHSNEEPYIVPWIEKSLDLSRLYLLPYASKDQSRNTSTTKSYNFMKLAFNVAEDLRSCNFQADTNSKSMVYQNIPVKPELMKTLLYNPRLSVSKLITSSSICGMTLNRIYTFDEAGYDYNMTTNWHVLTKDASGKTRFMILARASVNGTIDLKVNMDNHLVVSINSSDVAAQQGKAEATFGNYFEHRDLNGTVLLKMTVNSLPELSVTMECPEHGMDITYNTAAVLIEAHEKTRGRLVGLCGDNNGEKIAEFQKPSKTVVISPQEFAASYSLPEDQPLTTSKAPPSSTEANTESSSRV